MRRLFIVLLVATVACGKRGDPRPPVPTIPKATSDLVVTQRGNKLFLTWSYPSLTTAGKTLGSIRRVTVYRSTEDIPATPAPAPQPPATPSAAKPPAAKPTVAQTATAQTATAQTTTAQTSTAQTSTAQTSTAQTSTAQTSTAQTSTAARVPDSTVPPKVTRPTPAPTPTALQFGKLSQKIDSIESANLPASSVGAKLVYEDSPLLHSPSGRPVRITYAVVTEGLSARSNLSNLVAITPLDVAVPPTDLAAAPKAEGVTLTWTAPKTALTADAKPVITGYNIYRTGKGEALDPFAIPVNSSPVTRTDYLDNPPYGTLDYHVTAVAAAGPPRIESDPSAPVTATFKDLVPPPAPASVTALVETKVVRLVWDPVDVPDLAGYNVYRTEKAGKVKFMSGPPIKQTHFGDESLMPGIEYVYSVTAVDTSGNESKETKSQPVMVPKTQ